MNNRRLTLPPIADYRQILVECLNQHPTKKVNQYILLKKIGQGASSKVYISKDTTDNKNYAIKLFRIKQLRKNSDLLPIQREILALSEVAHPNIIGFKEALHSPEQQTAYLVMELGENGSLYNLIKKQNKLTEAQISSIFKQILMAIEHLHANDFVHFDVKPSNILLCKGGKAKLSDFGTAHRISSAESIVGTAAYQAPEIFDETSDDFSYEKTDIWSLGISLFETLFNRYPYNGNNVYEIAQEIKTTELVIPEVSKEAEEALRKMLCVNPKERPSAKELLKIDFFANASDVFDIPLKPIEPVMMDTSKQVVIINANVCTKDYDFYSESDVKKKVPGPSSPQFYRAGIETNLAYCL